MNCDEEAHKPSGRVLAFDVGSRRIGIAVSCPLGILAQPLCVIDRKCDDIRSRIVELLSTYSPERIVVGEPLSLKGESGMAIMAVQSFVQDYLIQFNIPIVWWDERLSTKAAERHLISANVSRKRRKQVVDKIAAAWILDSYLQAHCC
jgi:putative Holliday junction resolvase